MTSSVATEAAAASGDIWPGGPDPARWTCFLVRGVPHDEDLHQFDARYETTQYPAEWLWGPGTLDDALTWASEARPAGDTIDTLDRYLLLLHHEGLLHFPQDPRVAAATDSSEHDGTWFLLRADAPHAAFNHQRQILAGGSNCTADGECPQCPVVTIGSGTWNEAMELLDARGITPQPRPAPDERVPSLRRSPRFVRIAGTSPRKHADAGKRAG